VCLLSSSVQRQAVGFEGDRAKVQAAQRTISSLFLFDINILSCYNQSEKRLMKHFNFIIVNVHC